MNVKHPLDRYLFLDFCQRNELDPVMVEGWQDPEGKEWMPEDLAEEMEQMSEGTIPRSCWPRIRPRQRLKELRKEPTVPKVAVAEVPTSEGRPPYNPEFPLYAWLAKQKPPKNKLYHFAESEDISHQSISYFINGQQAITMELARRWERVSNGAVPWQSWPLVRRPGSPQQFWSYGKLIDLEEARRLRNLALPPGALAAKTKKRPRKAPRK